MDQVDYDKLLGNATERRDDMAAGPDTTMYDEILQKDDQQQNEQLMNSLFAVGGINPDQAAEAQKLGLELGVGPDIARRNMEELRRRSVMMKAQEYKLTATSPILARQLTDPEFAAIAQDDLAHLTTTEKTVQVMKNVGGSVGSGLSFDVSASMYGLARAGALMYGEIGDMTAGALGFDTSGDNPAQAAGKWLGQLQTRQQQVADYYGTPEGEQGIIGRSVYSGLRSLGRQIGTIPLLLLGPQAYLAANVASVGGQEYGKAIDKGMSPFRAALYAGGQTAVEYATEKIPAFRLIEDLGGGSGLIKTIGRQMAAEIPGEQVATVLQDLNEWAVLNPDKPFSSYLAERPSAAAETLIATIVATGAQTTLIKGAEAAFNKIDRAGADAWRANLMAENLRRLTDSAANSKLRQRSPEAYQKYVAAQTVGTPVENMYVDAAQLVEVLKQSNVSNGELDAMLPGLREQLAGAVLPGGNVVGDVKIATARYASHVAGTDLGNALMPHLRMGEDAVSEAEAGQFETLRQQMVDEAGKILEEKRATDEAFVKSAAEVESTLLEQLKATGIYTPEQSRAAATLQAATYTSLANQMGITPSEVYALLPYKQQAGAVTGQGAALSQSILEAPINIDPATPVPTVTLNDPVPDTYDWKVEKAWVKKHLQGQEIATPSGIKVRISGQTSKMAASNFNDPRRAVVLRNLPKIIRNAVVYSETPDTRGRPNLSYVYAASQVMIEGKPYSVGLSYSKSGEGNLIAYQLAGYEIIPPGTQRTPPAQASDLVLPGGKLAEDGNSGASTLSRNIEQVVGDFKAGNLPLFQGPRGGYIPQRFTTLLNEKADVSTVFHEFSHFYLDALTRLVANPAASEQMKADLKQLVEFGGATMEEWTGWTAEYDATGTIPEGMRRVHEAVAYNSEIYLFEGKAPAPELQGVFDRVVRWMKQVYTTIRDQLNAAYKAEFGTDLPMLTPEVRGVFDRMLASEDQIKQAEAIRNMGAMFTSQADSGMSPEEWAAYQVMLEEARDAAVTDLTKASLRQMQWLSNARGRILKQMQRAHEARRKEIRAEVEDEIKQRPVYRAMQFLKRGTIDGSEVEYPVKLSIPEIEAMYGDNPIVGLIKKGLGVGKYGMLASENAMHPDQVAEMFGFKSGDDLVRQLLAAPPMREAVAAETDARMLAENGDMNTPEALDAAVEAALHNEARARFVAVELRFLQKATEPVRLMLKAAQQIARGMISKKVVKDIRPKEFAAAEARAARKAMDLIKDGKSREAAQAKQAQLLQNQLAAEAIAAREEIAQAMQLFRKVFKADKAIAKGRNLDLVNAARAILAAHGIGKADKAPVEYTKQLQAYNPELYAELEPLIIRASAGARAYDTLTMDEFRGMRDAVAALWFQARRDHQIEVDGKKMELDAVEAELNDRLVAIGIPERVDGEKEAAGAKERMVRHLFQGKALIRRVEHWADATDGPGGPGPFTRYIWRPMRKAIDAYRAQRNIYVKRYTELLAAVDLPVAKIAAPELGYTFGNANGGIGKAEVLGALLHTGNDSNLRKLLLGRGWGKELEDGTLDTSRWDAFRIRMINEGVLTKADFDFLQAVWDLTEELKPQAQKAHHDLFGYYFKEVEAKGFTTPFGAYRGGYVPAKVDPHMVRDAQVHQKMEDMESDFRNSMPSTGMGFTKGRVEYNKPLSLDVRLIARHIDDVIRFSHVQPVVKDVLRILRRRGFADNLTRIDPTAIEGMLLPWLNRSARQITSEAGKHKAVDRFWSAVRSRAGIGIMFANITNALQQVTGYFPALLKVKPTYLKSALVQYMSGLQGMTDEVARLSPFMADRMQNQMFDLQDTMNDLLLNPSRYDKVQKWAAHHGYFLQQAFQNQVDVVTWTATLNQTLAELGADRTDAEATKEAVARADAAVRLTQSSLAPEDISAFEVGSPFYKTLIQFSGYFNMMANLNASEYTKIFRDLGWRGNKGKLFMAYLLGFGLPMLISDAIVRSLGGGWDDEDDDGYLDVFMSWFFGSQVRGAVALVPGAGLPANALFNALDDKPYNDRLSISPAITVLEAATFGAKAFVSNVIDPEKDVTGKNVRDVLTLISLITGIPVTVLGRPVGYQVDVNRGKVEPTSAVDYARGLATGKASPDSRQ